MFFVPMTRESRDLARNFDRHFDRLLDDAFGPVVGPAAARSADAARAPALDVAETDKAYTVTLEMPGVKKEDVKVTVVGRRVTIAAHSQSTDEKKDGERIVYRERAASSYSRSFSLPLEVDQASANASLNQGVLTLELPKRGAAAAAQLTIN